MKIVFGLLAVIVSIVLIFSAINYLSDKQIDRLNSKLDFIKKEITIMRFRLLDDSDNKLKIKYQFYNNDDEKVSDQITKEIQGSQLFIDFAIYKNKKSDLSLVFPLVIYSNKVPLSNGIEILTEYIDKDGNPLIYYNQDAKRNDLKVLRKIYNLITSGAIDRNKTIKIKDNKESLYYCSLFDVIGTDWTFEIGQTYKVIVHTDEDGYSSIEVVKEF